MSRVGVNLRPDHLHLIDPVPRRRRGAGGGGGGGGGVADLQHPAPRSRVPGTQVVTPSGRADPLDAELV